MTRTKKVTAKELDEQIGFNKEIDADALVAQMKKGIKKVRKAVEEATSGTKAVVASKISRKKLPPADKIRELTQNRTKKIKSTVEKVEKIVEEPKKTVTKVHIVPSKDNTCLEVWVAYKQEGYIRTIWKSYPTATMKEALKLAERYLSQIELFKVESIA